MLRDAHSSWHELDRTCHTTPRLSRLARMPLLLRKFCSIEFVCELAARRTYSPCENPSLGTHEGTVPPPRAVHLCALGSCFSPWRYVECGSGSKLRQLSTLSFLGQAAGLQAIRLCNTPGRCLGYGSPSSLPLRLLLHAGQAEQLWTYQLIREPQGFNELAAQNRVCGRTLPPMLSNCISRTQSCRQLQPATGSAY